MRRRQRFVPLGLRTCCCDVAKRFFGLRGLAKQRAQRNPSSVFLCSAQKKKKEPRRESKRKSGSQSPLVEYKDFLHDKVEQAQTRMRLVPYRLMLASFVVGNRTSSLAETNFDRPSRLFPSVVWSQDNEGRRSGWPDGNRLRGGVRRPLLQHRSNTKTKKINKGSARYEASLGAAQGHGGLHLLSLIRTRRKEEEHIRNTMTRERAYFFAFN